jgi:hypothetical protein
LGHLSQKILTLKRRASQFLVCFAFLGFAANLLYDCPAFSQESIYSSGEVFKQPNVCVAVSQNDSVGHRGHGCALDCSNKHEPVFYRSSQSFIEIEKLLKLQMQLSAIVKVFLFSTIADLILSPVAKISEATPATFSILSTIRSIRSVVILV